MEVPKENFVAKDKIWKDHVRTEETAAKEWPTNWNFLKTPYNEVVAEESAKAAEKARVTKSAQAKLLAAVQVRPVTPLSEYLHVEPSPQPVPPTVGRMVGWRSGDKKCQLEKYGRYCDGKGGLIKQLKWPLEAVI